MSSETSIKEPAGDALQPWQLFTLAGLIGATLVVFISSGHTPAAIVLISLTIFAAAAIGTAAWRTLMPFARPEELGTTQILGGRTRVALEREKALVLRSIKELEFDRAMGKVSDKDFNEMSARLRARAAGLLRQLDAGTTYRDDIKKEIEQRIQAGGAEAPQLRAQSSSPPGRNSGASVPVHGSGASAPPDAPQATGEVATPVTCPHCGTTNDTDAQFCKRCGASLETSE